MRVFRATFLAREILSICPSCGIFSKHIIPCANDTIIHLTFTSNNQINCWYLQCISLSAILPG